MTLLEMIKSIDSLDENLTVYAAEPWEPNSHVILQVQPEDGTTPQHLLNEGFCYFMELYLIKEFIGDWSVTLVSPISALDTCLRVIEYAINDA